MEDLKTEVVQEKNSGPRKGFFYDAKLGGYVPAKSESVIKRTEREELEKRNKLFIFIAIGVIGLLAYIFRDKLKTLWLKKTKEILSL
jgi:hypothetical protein